MAEPVDVKSTLNLPQTAFAMKAKLTQKEPELLAKWSEIGLYSKILARHAADPTFVLHDGPPYANGSIHLGTTMNKILKDFIVKSRTMSGRLAAYVPGWTPVRAFRQAAHIHAYRNSPRSLHDRFSF